MKRTITIEHEGREYGGEIMLIESTHLGVEDHGIATAFLHCKADSIGVGVGGFCLDTPVKDDDGRILRREGTAYGMDHIMQLVRVVGASSWEGLTGKHVIVLYEGSGGPWGSQSVGIASLDGDRVLILKDHSEQWRARADAEVTR